MAVYEVTFTPAQSNTGEQDAGQGKLMGCIADQCSWNGNVDPRFWQLLTMTFFPGRRNGPGMYSVHRGPHVCSAHKEP